MLAKLALLVRVEMDVGSTRDAHGSLRGVFRRRDHSSSEGVGPGVGRDDAPECAAFVHAAHDKLGYLALACRVEKESRDDSRLVALVQPDIVLFISHWAFHSHSPVLRDFSHVLLHENTLRSKDTTEGRGVWIPLHYTTNPIPRV